MISSSIEQQKKSRENLAITFLYLLFAWISYDAAMICVDSLEGVTSCNACKLQVYCIATIMSLQPHIATLYSHHQNCFIVPLFLVPCSCVGFIFCMRCAVVLCVMDECWVVTEAAMFVDSVVFQLC
jgi:hypothetical protein